MCTSPIEKLLPWLLPETRLFFFSSFFSPLLSFLIILFRAECWMLLPTDDCNLSSREPLDHPNRRGKKLLRAVNELPSVPRVKGACKLTGAFVRALFGFFFFPDLAPAFSSSPLLLPRSSIFYPYLLASCLGDSVAGAAPSGSGAALLAGAVHVWN